MNEYELYHYGVVGMKWGVRRARYKSSRADKLAKKAANYELKSSKLRRKENKAQAENLEGKQKRILKRAAKYQVKVDKLMKKSVSEIDDMKRLNLETKAAKYQQKTDKINMKANAIKRDTPYSSEAKRYASKADKQAYKASKIRHKIATDKRYVAVMNKRVSELSKEEINGKYSFVKDLFE